MRVCVCFYSDVLLCRLYSGEGCLGPDLYVHSDIIVFHVPVTRVSLVSLSSKTGVDIIETVSKGFVAQGFV